MRTVPTSRLLLRLLVLPALLHAAGTLPASPALWADDAGAETAAQRPQADAKAAEGRKLLALFNEDKAAHPQAVVDAAMAFSAAHKIYEALGDNDAVCDMQAAIFWCKKQMNLDAVQAYVDQKKGDVNTAEVVARIEQVAEKKVQVNEADAYLARARAFAQAHPDDLMGISIRWFEVAERFVGTPAGVEAQKQSLAAQDAYRTKLLSGEVFRETRFSRPARVESGKRIAVPAEVDQKKALADIKKLYAKAYNRKTPGDKRRLAAKLMTESEKSRSDGVIYYVMQSEAIRLSQEVEDYEKLLDGIDRLGGLFEGYDVVAQKHATLKRMTGKSTAQAIVTLMENPKDKFANAVAGRFFAFNLGRWPEGLPMLANGNDADLKKAAENDLSNPTSEAEILQTADLWYGLGKKTSDKDSKNGCYTRAMVWYQKILANLDGLTKDRVSQIVNEIDKTLPLDLDTIDWDNLTANQWGKLKGTVVEVQARVDRTSSGVILKPGEQMRVVPHPTDQWTFTGYWGDLATTGKGKVAPAARSRLADDFWSHEISDFGFGAVTAGVGTGKRQRAGIINGPGALWLEPNRPPVEAATGVIRVKLIPVADD